MLSTMPGINSNLMKHVLPTRKDFSICIHHQKRNSITAFISCLFFNAAGSIKTHLEKGNQSFPIRKTAFAFAAVAFLFLGVSDKSWAQRSSIRNMDFMNVGTQKSTPRK